MGLPNRIDTSTLGWVKGEIDQSLADARGVLGGFVEPGDDSTSLRLFTNSLHQVAGTLQMVELDGAAQLAQEIEALAASMIASGGRGADNQAKVSLLVAALKRLSSYMEGLARGLPDRPIDHVEVLNELRQARNAEPLDPFSLFRPDLEVYPVRDTQVEEISSEEYSNRVRELRRRFQAGLLSWLRDQDTSNAWQDMADVVSSLYAISRFRASMQVWWVARAYLDILNTAELSRDDPRKHPLAKLDQLMRKLAEEGEPVIARENPESLVRFMLYQIGLSEARSEAITSVVRLFELDTLLGGGEDTAGPAPEALATLRERALEPLRTVHATLDDYARGGEVNDAFLAAGQNLIDIADQAREAGVEELAQLVSRVHGLLFGPQTPARDDDILVACARALLFVEQTLEDSDNLAVDWRQHATALVDRLSGYSDDAETPSMDIESHEIDADSLDKHELRRLVATVAGQLGESLAVAEQKLEQFARDNADTDSLSVVVSSLTQVQGAARMLAQHKLCDLLELAVDQIQSIIDGETYPDDPLIDALAVAIGSADAYIKGLEGGSTNIDKLLERALRELENAASGESLVLVDPQDAVRRVQDSFDAWAADGADYQAFRTLRQGLRDIGALAHHQGQLSLKQITQEMTNLLDIVVNDPGFLSTEVRETLQRSLSALADLVGKLESRPGLVSSEASDTAAETGVTSARPEVDDDDGLVREVFAEEARECIESIASNLKILGEDHGNESALVEARRGFHTIKGSGRMAKAHGIAELAWIIEDLLNHCIDGVVGVSAAQVAFAADACREIEALVEKGLDSAVDLQAWRERAMPLQSAKGGGAHQDSGPGGEDVQGKTAVPAGAPPGIPEEASNAQVSEVGDESRLEGLEHPGGKEHGPARARATPEVASPFSDDEVIKIFSKEALSHIGVIRGVIDQCKRQGELPISKELRRAVHTLQGNARSLHLVQMSEAYTVLDTALEARERNGARLKKHQMEWLEALLIATAKVLDHLNRDRRFPEVIRQELAELAARIDTAWSDIEPLTASEQASPEEKSAPRVERLAGDVPERAIDNLDDAGPPTSVEESDVTDASVFDELFETEPTADPELEAVNDEDMEPGTVKRETEAAVTEVLPDPPPAGSARLEVLADSDLKDVFLEEATDILARIESTLEEGRGAGMTPAVGDNLKRELHTLKGSSRAAGVESIANLSHDAETMLQGVSGAGDAPPDLLETLEEVHDTLANLLQSLDDDRPARADPGLLGRLQGGVVDTEGTSGGQQANTGPTSGTSLIPEEGIAAPGDPAAVSSPESIQATAASPTGIEGETSADLPRSLGARSTVRIQSNILDKLVNYAGEVSISRSQLEEQLSGLKGNLNELRGNVARFSDQVRELDIQADTQIRARVAEETVPEVSGDFDPLEMDRYSRLQQLSRSLSESVDDLLTIQSGLNRFALQTESVLSQQAMLNSELQDGLMSARMVPFNTLAPRLRHQARQTSRELGKDVEFTVSGAELEVDRSILDQLSEALEHMIRNSLGHGIESVAARRSAGKPAKGSVRIDCRQEGREMVLKFSDDGAGLDVGRIKARAVDAGLLSEDSELSDEEVIQLVVLSGFSTAASVTQLSGRGIGLDVVNDAVRRLGGSLTLDNRPGRGVTFELRLPLSLSITQAMFVRCGDQRFAIPLGIIETVLKTEPENLQGLSKDGDPLFQRDDRVYTLMDLTATLGLEPAPGEKRVPVLLVRMGAREVALRVDELVGTDEIVVKQLGDHIGRISGINGATITGDGSVVLILDIAELWLTQERLPAFKHDVEAGAYAPPRVMVVDDSLTVRKVTGRNLGRRGMEVSMARDGFDALDQLASARPDVMLVDIEMPRMDGYELISRVRQDANHRHIPILVITSRAGAKHREKAMELGANGYLTKPYQERELLDEVNALLGGTRQSTPH